MAILMEPNGECPEVSIVLPVLNEAENIREVCRRLRGVLDAATSSYEVIFVAGGSTDGTEQAILREREADSRIKLLWLSRNFGHQEALTAGLDYATGQAVITMDGDLQHPPELLPELLAHWRNGAEVVTTIRLSTADAGLLKRTTSRWFYNLLNRLSNLELEEGSADFRLLSRPAVEALKLMPERSRFLRGMVYWIGFEQAQVSYHAAPREAGRSKYSVLRLLRFALLATVSFSAIPLYLLALLGFVFAGLSFVYGIFAVAARLLADVPIVGWASVLAGVMFIGGLQLASLGLLGVYVAKIFEEAKARPVYLMRSAHGFELTPGGRDESGRGESRPYQHGHQETAAGGASPAPTGAVTVGAGLAPPDAAPLRVGEAIGKQGPHGTVGRESGGLPGRPVAGG